MADLNFKMQALGLSVTFHDIDYFSILHNFCLMKFFFNEMSWCPAKYGLHFYGKVYCCTLAIAVQMVPPAIGKDCES